MEPPPSVNHAAACHQRQAEACSPRKGSKTLRNPLCHCTCKPKKRACFFRYHALAHIAHHRNEQRPHIVSQIALATSVLRSSSAASSVRLDIPVQLIATTTPTIYAAPPPNAVAHSETTPGAAASGRPASGRKLPAAICRLVKTDDNAGGTGVNLACPVAPTSPDRR